MTPTELEEVRTEKGRARRRREAARKRAEDLQQRLAQSAELRPGFGPRFAAGLFSVLTHLAGLAELRRLSLRQTAVSEAGVRKLSAALPKCRIEWDGGVIEPEVRPESNR